MSKAQESTMRGKLSSLVWEFNFRPDHYVHDSWLVSMPDGELIRKLVGKHRGAERIVSHLMQRLGLENQVFFNFSNSLAKMALWNGDDLERIVLHAGAVLNYERVQLVVGRDEIMQIREEIGDEMYFYMQRRVPMIMRRPPSGVIFPHDMRLKNRVVVGGMLVLNEAFGEFPPALRKRLMLKLPKIWFELLERHAELGVSLKPQHTECVALIQKIAIDSKIGVSHDGQIRFG